MAGTLVEEDEQYEAAGSRPARKFTVGQFDCPLDLLWSLIREQQINIYDIPIADITEQYLDYPDYALETDLQDLSEFYAWAAKLIYIKSRTLLPEKPSDDLGDESMEDPRMELVDQLIEYQKFKKLSLSWKNRKSRGSGALSARR